MSNARQGPGRPLINGGSSKSFVAPPTAKTPPTSTRRSSSGPDLGPTTNNGESRCCDRCEDQVASKYCVECAIPLCDSCIQDLHKKGRWAEHQIVPLVE
jgi:hypothetical protein